MKTLTKKRLTIILGFLFFLGVTLLTQSVVRAATGDDALDKPLGNFSEIGELTNAIFQLGIAACVLAASIYIAFGAFYYFVGAASNAKMAEDGKKVIERAIIGLVLALISWILLNTIHPQFTQLETPKFGGGASQN